MLPRSFITASFAISSHAQPAFHGIYIPMLYRAPVNVFHSNFFMLLEAALLESLFSISLTPTVEWHVDRDESRPEHPIVPRRAS